MKVYNMTILAKDYHVKFNRESVYLYIYMYGMWPSFLLILAFCISVTLYDNVHMHHSNSQLTSWIGGNGPVHVWKEDKQVKQHSYVTFSYLQYINTSQKLSCQIERRKCLLTWTACDQVSYWFLHVCLSVTLYDNVHMYHFNNQLTAWVGKNGQVHVEKEDKQVKQHSYVTTLDLQYIINTSQRLSC